MTLGLGIDTSFDDTALAIVEDGHKILANLKVSQFAEHEEFGGVVPERASRLHIEMIFPLLEESLKKAGKELGDLDYIAVSNRPGLMGSLLVGVTVAKALSMALNRPLVAVNHLEAHIHALFMEYPELKYPFLSMLISGANTLLIHHRSFDDFELIGATLDDAVGECIDKCGRTLGLSMPAGPALQELALKGDPKAMTLPKPMIKKAGFDFSFSGLKTAVLYGRRDHPDWPVENFAASLLESIAEVIKVKTQRALKAHNLERLVLCGGAAANLQIREKLAAAAKQSGTEVYVPSLALCTDNAAMIAGLGQAFYSRGRLDNLDVAVKATVSWKQEEKLRAAFE